MVELRRASCHCGAVELEISFERGLENLRRCDCSLCRRKGAVMASVPLAALKVVKGGDQLACYRWNTMVAEHYFCRTCGIYTHHRRRSDPRQYGINIGCVEGVDPFAYGEVPIGGGSLDAPLPPLP
jgi:hypothetical protein